MTKEGFRWGYIGYGGIAKTTARQLKRAGHQLVAVWGRNPDKCRKFAKKYKATPYTSLSDMLKDPKVDGVYIATTNDTHYDFSKMCMENEKPTLCEKAFTLNKRQAEEVFDLAEKKNTYISEAMWTWHNDVSLQVKKWIDEKRIGEIVEVKGSYALAFIPQNKKQGRFADAKLGGGALLDIGLYPIHYVYKLFGMPKTITCECLERVKQVDFEESVVMKYGDFSAKLFISMSRYAGEKIEIFGTEGKIVIPFFHSALHAYLYTKDKKYCYKRKSNPYASQFAHVAQEITEGEKQGIFVDKKATLDVMALLDECRRQINVVYPQEL